MNSKYYTIFITLLKNIKHFYTYKQSLMKVLIHPTFFFQFMLYRCFYKDLKRVNPF